MAEGCISRAPLHDDITTYTPEGEALEAEAILGGWPCQACQVNCQASHIFA